MISLLQYVSNKIFSRDDAKSSNSIVPAVEESIESLLTKIEDIKQENEETKEVQLNLISDDEKGCFYKTGTITLVNDDYVLIEGKYACQTKFIIPQDLKVGDKIQYMAYKVDKSEDLKVHKITSKTEAPWEEDDKIPNCNAEKYLNIKDFVNRSDDKNDEVNDESLQLNNVNDESNQNIAGCDGVIQRAEICERTVVGKVGRRRGREIFLEDNDTICVNLDNVSSDFVPVIGDWIKLKCQVEVDESRPNFQGEILRIDAIDPLRMLKRLGSITHYNELAEHGVIENSIVFIKAVCSAGFMPCVRDKVIVQAIESDQGVMHHWRALVVTPLEDITDKFETAIIKFKPQMEPTELEEMIKDKENIEITDRIKLCLDAKTDAEFEVVLKNNGNFKQIIYKCSFYSKKSQSQLHLTSPEKNDSQELRPGSELVYKFKCKARLVGTSEELIIFKFKNFKIGRIIQIKVNSINPTQLADSETPNAYDRNEQKSIIPKVPEDGMYIRGVKPYKPAKFITNRPKTWKIPAILWETINKIYVERKTRSEAEFLMTDSVPVFQQPLSIKNYKQRFDYLLFLEEIAQTVNMGRFILKSATMRRAGEYLTLNVPGLAEKRPSLIAGDRAIISFHWDETCGQKEYEGYIHKIRSSDVYLKFNPKFHESYNGEDCQAKFKGSTTVIQRCHTAIEVAANRLGADFLFPKKVVQKEPQYNFIDEDESVGETELDKVPKMNDEISIQDEIIFAINRRKIEWRNKRLNKYQRTAVKNVLKGIARPLPYVIFGPPGTGKTITVCEAILQILQTITESRILIATPSNSSANLIAERLLDSRQLKPGDMVRLVAHHYLESESIPERLIPYCATADIGAEGSRADVNLTDPRGYQMNLTLSVLCRHRVIIGTCTALGILYNMGCKPGHFTHVFIDEAGQACEPEIMIPLSLAHPSSSQVILAGDPKQLGPVNQCRLAGYFGLNDSFLVRLLQQFPYQRDPEGFAETCGYDPRLVTKLLMNYRSLPDLLDLPNKLFYENELIPQVHPDRSEEARLLDMLSDMLPKRLGSPPAVVFVSVNGKNIQDQDSPSWYNPEEATQVYIYLMELYNHGLRAEDVGIITPYSKQVYRIRSLLAEFEVEIPKVGSVEEFQGQERKVIILSTVRTAEEKVKEDVRHSLGFVGARERLNVAITRSRALLIIIGNPKLLQQDVYWRSVIEHCHSRHSFIGHEFSLMR